MTRKWDPIPIRQLDLTKSAGQPFEGFPLPTRTWLEVLDRDQIVGVVDLPPGDASLSAQQLNDFKERVAASQAGVTPPVAEGEFPAVSIVVPTICRDPERLERTVRSFTALDYPSFEVIIVDNRAAGSEPPLPQFFGMPGVRRAEEPKPGISAARNRGVSLATGEIVAFTDDDAVVEPNWLRALIARFVLSPEVEAVGGLIMPLELHTEPQLWFEEFYGGFSRSYRAETFSLAASEGSGPLFPYAPAQFGAGGNMALRRATLERVGGFDVRLGTGTVARGGEDLAMFLGLLISGSSVAFEPRAIVRHMHRRTKRAFYAQIVGYGTGLTAMYTALVWRDPRHLVAMAWRLPKALRYLLRPRADRSPSRAPTYPRYCVVLQVYGMSLGPLAYLRSALHDRREARATRAQVPAAPISG